MFYSFSSVPNEPLPKHNFVDAYSTANTLGAKNDLFLLSADDKHWHAVEPVLP
jgi:hypothetical protein